MSEMNTNDICDSIRAMGGCTNIIIVAERAGPTRYKSFLAGDTASQVWLPTAQCVLDNPIPAEDLIAAIEAAGGVLN